MKVLFGRITLRAGLPATAKEAQEMQHNDKNLYGIMAILWHLNYVATHQSVSAFTHGKPQLRSYSVCFKGVMGCDDGVVGLPVSPAWGIRALR